MRSTAQSNPFSQPAKQWQIRVLVHGNDIAAIEEAFADLALSTSSFEVDELACQWCVDVVIGVPPEKADLHARLALMSGVAGIPTPPCEVRRLEPKDWVSEVQQNFPPLEVGRFYVHGTHITSQPPGKIALMISAGTAFGSGEHATTSGCLLALSFLSRRRRFARMLDMGCGSGILAIAMAKLWHAPVIGIDIDPVSVEVAHANAVLNRVRKDTVFEAADGYHAPIVRLRAPFDLVAANILARPLVRMSPMLAESLAPHGVAVLSGLLSDQERMVLAAHRMQGLRLQKRIVIGNWHTLLLAR